MEGRNFKFKFKHNGQTIPADCQIMTSHVHPQYRVLVMTKTEKEKVFTFYKISRTENKFFWFPVSPNFNGLVHDLADALAKYSN